MTFPDSTGVCVSLAATSFDDLTAQLTAVSTRADAVEIRADYLAPNEREKLLVNLEDLLQTSGLTLVLTLRANQQGGQSEKELTLVERESFFLRALPILARHDGYADLELDLVWRFQEREDKRNITPFQMVKPRGLRWERIICSHHDFTLTPTDLTKIYQQLACTRAGVLKIAVTAHDAHDCLTIFELYRQARADNKKLIALAMNDAGIPTRILAARFNAAMTYAALDNRHRTAHGQPDLSEMRELYRVPNITPATEVFGIVGNPVHHSLSPVIHNTMFARRQRNAVYVPFQVDDIESFIKRGVHPQTRETELEIKGLSVTAPHKQRALKLVSQLDDTAREVEAVNTIVVRDGELYGYNTDVEAALAPFAEMSLSGARVAVIGAGGAARSVLAGLRRHGASVTVFARHLSRAAPLAAKYNVELEILSDRTFQDFDVVINTTPLGTRGDLERETPAVRDQLQGVECVYDLVYNPAETRLLQHARAAGCQTFNGLPMLIKQAAAQFALWTNTPRAEAEREMQTLVTDKLNF